jgi:glycosyltransferase involved in cell wall biosynthesis
MTVGLPVVGLATTELSTVIENGVSGFLDTDPARLTDAMRELLVNRALARNLGRAARRRALERFGIRRFARDWEQTFASVTGRSLTQGAQVTATAEGVR